MSDPCSIGIAALAAAYAAGESDPVFVTEAYLARIAKQDGSLRSYITVATATAKTAAEESRRRWREHRPLGSLDGVPIALKDNIDVAGIPCTAGTAAFRHRVPEMDANVVALLKRQGAVILGKLNMHEAALGATTDNLEYGRCMNPVRAGYTPGGSSGGSGAAVAARLCAAALGTDTMGSVRVPAAYCGIVGFKPTSGAIRSDGVIPLSFTLDAVGPLAWSIEDVALISRALLEPPVRALRARSDVSTEEHLQNIRIAVPDQIAEVKLEPEVKTAFTRFLDLLRAAGATIVRLDLSPWDPSKTRRAGLLISEAEGHLYYAEQLGAELPGLTPGIASMLRYPEKAGIARLTTAYRHIEAVRTACMDAFCQADLLALPTTPQTSFPHASKAPDNQADCTALANVARSPAISLPFVTDPLPIGVQLMAAPGDDLRLLALAALIGKPR